MTSFLKEWTVLLFTFYPIPNHSLTVVTIAVCVWIPADECEWLWVAFPSGWTTCVDDASEVCCTATSWVVHTSILLLYSWYGRQWAHECGDKQCMIFIFVLSRNTFIRLIQLFLRLGFVVYLSWFLDSNVSSSNFGFQWNTFTSTHFNVMTLSMLG